MSNLQFLPPILNIKSKIVFHDIKKNIKAGNNEIIAEVDGSNITLLLDISERQREHILAGGTLNFVKQKLEKK